MFDRVEYEVALFPLLEQSALFFQVARVGLMLVVGQMRPVDVVAICLVTIHLLVVGAVLFVRSDCLDSVRVRHLCSSMVKTVLQAVTAGLVVSVRI